VRWSVSGEEGRADRRLASLQVNLKYDTKDRYTFPASGRASEMSFEFARDVLGAEETFQKFEGYIEAYQTAASVFTLHPRVSIGSADEGLPVYERFRLGGTRSFIGYRTDQLVGDKYFLVNLEFRLGPVYRSYLSFRYDMGDVFDIIEQFRTNELRHSFGFILGLDTPLGPFCVAYGRAEGKYDNLYLNLGYDF
jgi:NTE family protein